MEIAEVAECRQWPGANARETCFTQR